ncbi:MAG: serine/threonine protein kinase [Ktedonobacteraceae bacterium]
MICPRCGNEWDATKGACTRCGFVVRTAGQSGSFPNQSNVPQRGNQISGGLTNPARQQSNGMTSVKQQSVGLSIPMQPGFPTANGPLTPPPAQNSNNNGFPNSSSQIDRTFPKPTFEKNVLKGIPQSTPQSSVSSIDSLSRTNTSQAHGTAPNYSVNRSSGSLQQDMRLSQAPVQPQMSTRQHSSESTNRNMANQQMPRPASSFQQVSNTPAQIRSNVMTTNTRPLLPGILLRGGRYRLLELQERQDWLSGVFEAVWIGKDAHRAGSQVMITEVVLPENSSVVTQTLLRTATMALATVGRHPHIPGLWDAFSDQGRSFFVFEPVEGETLMGRMRYSGRPLPEQEVIECCLQLTDVLELLSQQSPQLVHGLIRPEHIVLSRNNSQYILTNFSIVLAGGGMQYVAGMERSRLSAYAAPEFVRGVVDVRTDLYSLIATAFHAVAGSPPVGVNGSIPQAQRINPNVSPAFDAILSKGLRPVPNQRYQRPSELRQDLLTMRSVSGTLVSGTDSNQAFQNRNPNLVVKNGQQTFVPTQQATDQVAQALPLFLNTNGDLEDQVLLLPKPEELPPVKAGNDTLNAAVLLGLILLVLVVIVVISQMTT